MPDYSFNVNYPQPQKQMSLGDMVNLAGNIQNYQQQQITNPLSAAKAAIDTQKAQLDLQQARQANPMALEKAFQEMQQSQIGTKQKQLEFDKSHLDVTGGALTGLESRAKVLAEKKDSKQALKELDATEKMLNAFGIPSRENGPFAQAREALKNNDFDAYLSQLETMRGIQASAESKFQANTPQAITNAAGQIIGYTRSGNQIQTPAAGQAPAAGGQMGGGQAAGAPSPNFNLGANPSSIQAQSTGNIAKQAINDYTDAITTLPSIANQEMVDKKILSFLKNDKTKTGPIADYLANKTNWATLSQDEQEVVKLLQQRIQNLNPKSDADAESKRQAFGTFRAGKDALADLIRQDLGTLSHQRISAHGTISSAGDAANPNLPGVAQFRSNLAQMSKSPAYPYVMQYIGIVGRGKEADIDSHDEQALLKLKKLSGMSLKDLEAQRKQVLEFTKSGE